MQKHYNTIIVGGGASGLFSAIELVKGTKAFKGEEILVLERNDRVGKKLLATGNGQCNLTNQKISTENYYGDKFFIEQFMQGLKNVDLKKYLSELGIFITANKDGKVYPLSKQASSVLDMIRNYLAYKKCTILTGKRVSKINKNKELFEVYVGSEKFSSKNLILATGGMAGKQFGTDGSAYQLAENFGHKKTLLFPSLVQLKTPTADVKGLKGIKEYARVTSFVGNKPLMSAEGDLLFTDFGVSGSTIFNVSASIADKKDAYLIIEFLPNLTFSEVESIVQKRLDMSYISGGNLLCGILNKKVGQTLIRKARSMSATDIAYSIKNFKLSVTGSLDFSYAQVTRGGIDTSQIEPMTFKSKLIENLYIVGEELNVDGDCGGYNLTFAFISGILSAKTIKEKR